MLSPSTTLWKEVNASSVSETDCRIALGGGLYGKVLFYWLDKANAFRHLKRNSSGGFMERGQSCEFSIWILFLTILRAFLETFLSAGSLTRGVCVTFFIHYELHRCIGTSSFDRTIRKDGILLSIFVSKQTRGLYPCTCIVHFLHHLPFGILNRAHKINTFRDVCATGSVSHKTLQLLPTDRNWSVLWETNPVAHIIMKVNIRSQRIFFYQ